MEYFVFDAVLLVNLFTMINIPAWVIQVYIFAKRTLLKPWF